MGFNSNMYFPRKSCQPRQMRGRLHGRFAEMPTREELLSASQTRGIL
jgi:hypothetical protein